MFFNRYSLLCDYYIYDNRGRHGHLFWFNDKCGHCIMYWYKALSGTRVQFLFFFSIFFISFEYVYSIYPISLSLLISTTSIPRPSSTCGPELPRALPVSVSPYVGLRGGECFLPCSNSIYRHSTSDRALTLCDRHSVQCHIDDGVWVKCWLPCSGRGMSVSCCIGPSAHSPFVSAYEEAEHEKDL